jgi:hypothetical protein
VRAHRLQLRFCGHLAHLSASYKSNLNELQVTLEQIRVTLLVPQASLRASQSQLPPFGSGPPPSETREPRLVTSSQTFCSRQAQLSPSEILHLLGKFFCLLGVPYERY